MDPCPKGLFTDNYWTRVFKGAFQGCIGGGRWPLVEIAQSSLIVSHLEIGHHISDQLHFDRLKYS